MSESDDVEFELITSAKQFVEPPKLRKLPVTLTPNEWPTRSGKGARLFMHELKAGAFFDFQDEGWTYKDGVRQSYDSRNEDYRFLAYVAGDAHGTRLWPSWRDARDQLERIGRSTFVKLMKVANEVNNEREEATEGNSEEIQSGS